MPPPESMESPPKSGIFAFMSFDETELTLRLPDNHCPLKKLAAMAGPNCLTRGRFLTVDLNAGRYDVADGDEIMSESSLSSTGKSPAAKADVAGWPPVRSFRKKALESHAHAYVKVAVDGAPYLRKVNLEAYGNYPDLLRALEEMSTGFSTCNNNNLHKERQMVPTYEDRDGDWMLVGDVPWKMFKDSCKRIRVMKSSECLGMAWTVNWPI
ncbi:auxin-responsive protein IAA1-like [Diospyros lotus]|uniref:auxin-responsive protein IAA1-like n=1 Tax=Diospyros lotus TaxID=55363 RepID=UPI0022531CA9|nr:auxin-responsive protein IAA1-like [Diospyros lotus]